MANKKLKYFQLLCMLKVYKHERMRTNLKSVTEVLNSLMALQHSMPVIENLIANAGKEPTAGRDSFELGLQLIQHANQLTDTKLKGLKLQDEYRHKLFRLQTECCSRIEAHCVAQVNGFLKTILYQRDASMTKRRNQLKDVLNEVFHGDDDFEMEAITDFWNLIQIDYGSTHTCFPEISVLFLESDQRQ